MKEWNKRFSRREGFSPDPNSNLIYDDFPQKARNRLFYILHDKMQLSVHELRDAICGVLDEIPDRDNWSEMPVRNEVESLIEKAKWYQVYDIVEHFASIDHLALTTNLINELNDLFESQGLGWRLVGRILQIRGGENFERVSNLAKAALETNGFAVALGELAEAHRDISKRPNPDLSGTIQHVMAALESIARHKCNAKKDTLGQILSKNPNLFPPPLGDAIEKIWGWASNEARHGHEDRKLDFPETILVFGIAATMCDYLCKKFPAST